MKEIIRKSLLYKTGVEYGDYTINHAFGCSHGCKYPCYAFLMAKRFGKAKTYEQWCEPSLVSNAVELLKKEIPAKRSKIDSVHLCFSTDPFMFRYPEICDMSIKLIRILNESDISCTALTKGVFPAELLDTDRAMNRYGITLISLNEDFRIEYEPGSAPYEMRLASLRQLHDAGFKTWVSIEPYPTPNILEQDFDEILNAISFVDRIIFGKLNYNPLVTKFPDRKNFFTTLAYRVIEFCEHNRKEYHIKDGTLVENNINPF